MAKNFMLLYKLSIVLLLLVGILFIQYFIAEEKRTIQEQNAFVAEQIKKSLSYNINYLRYQLLYASRQVKDLDVASDFKRKSQIGNILSSFLGNINNQVDIYIAWNAFSWIDSNNHLVVDGAGGVIKTPVDLTGKRDYLDITSKSPNVLVFGDPVWGAISSRHIIPVAMGVFSDENIYLGTLVFGLDVDRILSKLEKNIGNETYNFAVLRDSKVILSSNRLDNDDKNFALELSSKMGSKKLEEVGKIVRTQNLFTKHKSFSYLQEMQELPLRILVFYDKDKSYHQMVVILLKQSLVIALILVALLVLFQKIHKEIIQPLHNLSRLALKIAKKDFSEFAIEKPSKKELNHLLSALNMVRDVLKREEDLLQELETSNIKLLKANEAKADLLSKSSHDIKNYIYGICGLASLISDSNAKKEFLKGEDKKIFDAIAAQSKELMCFVEDLLDINQQESGEIILDRMQDCDVVEMVERIVLLNRGLAIRHHVEVKVENDDNIPALRCDLRRMKQIFVNIVTNAIKYSFKNTEVVVRSRYLQKEQKICIEVQDQGIGMSEDEIQLLLAGAGQDIQKPDMENIDSYGIGMQITLKLIELHQGQIIVDSKKNKGTKIKLLFDVNGESLKENKEKRKPLKVVKGSSILLVDDNPVNIKVTSKIFGDAGYKVYSAENGEEALEKLDKEKIDIVLMDIEMPKMNGFEATKHIRKGTIFKKFTHYKEIPIVILSSFVDSESKKKIIDVGADLVLEKTIHKANLLNVIAKVLG